MAKLASVKVIDNKIEVDGVTYERTDEDVRAGDIVQCFERTIDLTLGSFYKVEIIDSDGDLVIIDDAGDGRSRKQDDSDFVHYRKVAAEAEKFEVGDYVRVITGDEELPKGTIGRIMAIYRTGGYSIIVETIDGSDYDWYRTDQIEKVDATTAKWAAIGRKVGEIKVGDIVRILRDNPYGSRHKKGDIGTVDNVRTHDFRVITAREGDAGCWVISDSVELVAPVESTVNLRGVGA